MARKGTQRRFAPLQLLAEQDVNLVLDGTYSVLSNTGVVVKSKKMQSRLSDYGCRVDAKSDRVYFDKATIDYALEHSPSLFTATARDEKNDVELSSGKGTLFLNACGTNTIDLDTNEIREPTRKEFYDYLRVLDYLPNVDMQNCFAYFGFKNVPECMKLIESAAAKYRVSTKAQIEGSVFDNYIFTTQMAQAMEVDLLQIVNSAAPLTYFEETTDQIEHYANAKLPFHFAAGPTRGMTCPISYAGAVISNNAEALAGIVMAQAVMPQSRVWVNSMIMTPDMKTGKVAFGDIGNSITDALFAQTWQKYGIPSWSNAAAWTSSKAVDYQAGYEMAMALLMQALSGASVISFQGGLYAQLCVHPAKAIVDDDVVGMVKRMLGGVDTSQEGLAVDLIQQTGPMPGSFMQSDLTLDTWRDVCYVPAIECRESYSQWQQNGKKGAPDRAREKLSWILANHTPPPLSEHKEQALEAILKDARVYYRKKGMISDEEWKRYSEDLASSEYPYA